MPTASNGRAIILAAGLSSRLYPLTRLQHKAMLEVVPGQSILDVQLESCAKLGLDDITVVTGHAAEALEEHVGERATCRRYPDFAVHGNLHTLHSVRDLLDGRVVVAFADLVAPFELWERTIRATSDFALLVDEGRSIPGTMRTRGNGATVEDLGPHIPVEEGTGTFVGLAAFSPRATVRLRDQLDAMVHAGTSENCVYTYALAELVERGETLTSIPTLGARWIEVDDADDYGEALDLAKSWSSASR